MTVEDIIKRLEIAAEPEYLKKLEYFKSDSNNAIGIRIPVLRNLAKEIKMNHPLAIELWKTEIHEARILATMLADYKKVDSDFFDKWVADFNSWDLCDQACFNLLDKTELATEKIYQYAKDEREFVKRTSFSLIAGIAIHNKKLDDNHFIPFLKLIEDNADDDRNFVKKAVNWALRQIGKRSEGLRVKALETSYRIKSQESKSAKWIAKDAIRELESDKVILYIKNHR